MKKINKKTLMYFLLAYISGCFYAFGFLRLNSNFNKSLEGLLLGSLFPGGFVGLGLVAIFLVFVLGTIITKVEKVIYGIKNEFGLKENESVVMTICLGYADASKALYPRRPRLMFNEIATVL